MKKELFPANTIDSVDYDLNYMKSVVHFDWWESNGKTIMIGLFLMLFQS